MAFKILDKSLKFDIALYPKVEREDPVVGVTKGFDKVGGFTLRDKVDFMPQKGLQERFCACDSNLIFLCGPSQMGKTYAMLQKAEGGLGLPGFTVRFINVRLQDGKKGGSIFRDAVEVLGNYAGCQYSSADYPTFYWPQWNNSFQIIHSNFNADNPAEYEQFKDYAKKNQASLIMIDEATEMRTFKMFKYWFSRNRDSSGMTPQMVLSFNYVYGHFTNNMLKDAGYFTDDWYFRPEMNGVTRYFYIQGETEDTIVWGNTPEEVAKAVGISISEKERKAGVTLNQIVKSFTAFTGEAADNLKLLSATGGQNIGNLHNVGGKESAILLKGYAGPIENEEINVSRQMITRLWENPKDEDDNMYVTFDVGGGKGDSAPLIIWRGLQMIAIEYFTGEPQELAGWIQTHLNRYGIPVEHFAYDGTGFGYWLQGLTNGISVTANKRPLQEYDEHGNPVTKDEFFNCRSQLLGKLEVALKRGDISCVIDRNKQVKFGTKNETRRFIDVLYDGVNLFIITKKNGKTYYNSKEEFKSRFKYSPGELDAMSLRMVFELDTRERKQSSKRVPDNAYFNLVNRPRIINRWRGFR